MSVSGTLSTILAHILLTGRDRLSLGRLGSVKIDSITSGIRRSLFPRVSQSTEEAQLSAEDKIFRVRVIAVVLPMLIVSSSERVDTSSVSRGRCVRGPTEHQRARYAG
jgi:hypothetical protein